MNIALVAAVARNGVIGRDGGIPWHLPEDLAHFRALTTGHAVVMGRRTWDSLPQRFRPLPNRRNVVVTRDADWAATGAERAGSVEHALALVASEEQVFVIGGAEIYAAALPHADELILTELDLAVEGDTFFPGWEPDQFEEATCDEHVSTDGTAFAFVTYRRSVAARQLAALADVSTQLQAAGLEHWLFGGWAVDFYVGRVTRPHFDVDLATWLDDLPCIGSILEGSGWVHAPEADEEGGTGYERDGTRLELTYLVRDAGRVFTPLREFEATWPDGAFGMDERELRGVRVRLVSVGALASGKSTPRDDPGDAAKDRVDFDILSSL